MTAIRRSMRSGYPVWIGFWVLLLAANVSILVVLRFTFSPGLLVSTLASVLMTGYLLFRHSIQKKRKLPRASNPRMANMVFAGVALLMIWSGLFEGLLHFVPPVMIMLAGLGLLWTFFEPWELQLRGYLWWMVGVIVVVYGVRAAGLVVYPEYRFFEYTDEPWNLNFIHYYLENRTLGDTLFMGKNAVNYPIIPKYWIIVSAWMQMVGVGIWQGRLFHMLLTMVVVIVTALAVNNLYRDRLTAVFTALFLIASPLITTLIVFRNDVPLAVCLSLAVWGFSAGERYEKPWLHAVGGFFAGLGGFAHFNAIPFGAAFLIGLYLPLWVVRIRHKQFLPPLEMVLFGMGGLVSGGLLLATIIIPNWETLYVFASPRTSQEVNSFVGSTLAHVRNVGQVSVIDLALVLSGVIAVVIRRDRRDLSILLTIVLCHLAIGYTAATGYDQYIRQFAFLYGILAARFLRQGISVTPRVLSSQRAAAVALVLLALLMPTMRHPFQLFRSGESLRMPAEPVPIAWIQAQDFCDDAMIMGPHYYYFWLHDLNFVSIKIDGDLLAVRGYTHLSTRDLWDTLQPAYVIIDPNYASMSLLLMEDEDYLEGRGYEVLERWENSRANAAEEQPPADEDNVSETLIYHHPGESTVSCSP